jgi:hypothetical protein
MYTSLGNKKAKGILAVNEKADSKPHLLGI